MAFFSSSVPELVVYFVKFASMAACAAAPMCRGVGKSGSPAPRSTTSMPFALRAIASAATFMVGEAAIRVARAASDTGVDCAELPMISGPQRLARELLLAQAAFDDVRNDALDGSAQGDDFLHEARAHVRVRLGRHHEHRLHLGVEAAVHERHLHLVFEIRHGAQPPDDDTRLSPS